MKRLCRKGGCAGATSGSHRKAFVTGRPKSGRPARSGGRSKELIAAPHGTGTHNGTAWGPCAAAIGYQLSARGYEGGKVRIGSSVVGCVQRSGRGGGEREVNGKGNRQSGRHSGGRRCSVRFGSRCLRPAAPGHPMNVEERVRAGLVGVLEVDIQVVEIARGRHAIDRRKAADSIAGWAQPTHGRSRGEEVTVLIQAAHRGAVIVIDDVIRAIWSAADTQC